MPWSGLAYSSARSRPQPALCRIGLLPAVPTPVSRPQPQRSACRSAGGAVVPSASASALGLQVCQLCRTAAGGACSAAVPSGRPLADVDRTGPVTSPAARPRPRPARGYARTARTALRHSLFIHNRRHNCRSARRTQGHLHRATGRATCSGPRAWSRRAAGPTDDTRVGHGSGHCPPSPPLPSRAYSTHSCHTEQTGSTVTVFSSPFPCPQSVWLTQSLFSIHSVISLTSLLNIQYPPFLTRPSSTDVVLLPCYRLPSSCPTVRLHSH